MRPPVERDATPGYILSRSLEVTGRPVAFAFAAAPPAPAGSEVFLRAGLLRQSLNYRSLDRGQSYPLFYDTLFADLRTVLAKAATTARQARRGLWRSDRSRSGLLVRSQTDLEQNGVIFPKVFRRLTEYLRRQGRDLSEFLPWLELTREQVVELPTTSFTHFEDVLDVQANTIRLRPRPEELVFVSAKTTALDSSLADVRGPTCASRVLSGASECECPWSSWLCLFRLVSSVQTDRVPEPHRFERLCHPKLAWRCSRGQAASDDRGRRELELGSTHEQVALTAR